MKRRLLGIGGKARAGKDVLGKVLINQIGYTKVSFADSLKDICSEVFGFPVEEFHSDRKDDQYVRPLILTEDHIIGLLDKAPDRVLSLEPILTKFIDKEIISHRHLLQFVGTDIMRDSVDKDIWLKLFEARVQGMDRVVCCDMRFENERALIKKLGGRTILIQRPENRSVNPHISEQSLGEPEDYDIVVTNDDTLIGLEMDFLRWANLYDRGRLAE